MLNVIDEECQALIHQPLNFEDVSEDHHRDNIGHLQLGPLVL